VTYQYAKDDKKSEENIFSSLNLKIKAGTKNAIVGPSGFGKTTLFNMIFRMLDPDQGDVFIDG
jgi:ABC-type multidrug transport system fused ATPase/permease subunit